jgi:PPOX class probable F420-dependent enzyme
MAAHGIIDGHDRLRVADVERKEAQMLDGETEFGRRAIRRLEQEPIIWLSTVDRHGAPQPRPVWFYWKGESVLIYSRPGTAKLDHIRRNPHVSLHFDGDGLGGDIVVLLGRAELDVQAGQAIDHPQYLGKYADGLRRIEMTAENFSREYSVALRVRPTAVRGH